MSRKSKVLGEWIIRSELDDPRNRMEDGLELVGELVRCKDCKWYDERISLCDNCGLPREHTFFCKDGRRK